MKRNWKAVIATSDVAIAKELRNLISWDKLNIDIVDEAREGNALKTLIELYDPDIVVTEVILGYRTGMEIIHWCNQTKRKARFIFVSGRIEYSRVQNAMAHGAVDFLLKPVDRGDLVAALSQAIYQLRMGKSSSYELVHESEIDWEHADQLEKDMTFRKVKRMVVVEGLELDGRFLVGLCVGLRPDYYRKVKRDNPMEYRELKEWSINEFMALLGKQNVMLLIQKTEDVYYLLGAFPKEDEADYVEKYILPAKQKTEQKYETELTIAFGNKLPDMENAYETYTASKFAFLQFPYEMKNFIYSTELGRKKHVSSEEIEEKSAILLRTMLSGESSVLEGISELIELICWHGYGDWDLTRQHVISIIRHLDYRIIDRVRNEARHMILCKQLFREIEVTYSMIELKRKVMEYYGELLASVTNDVDNIEQKRMTIVQSYISNHFDEDLSVRFFADMIGVKEERFGPLFKKETGWSFKEYLTKCRLEKATMLLRYGDKKVSEIAREVGYHSEKRFSEAFKKMYGLAPKQYAKK